MLCGGGSVHNSKDKLTTCKMLFVLLIMCGGYPLPIIHLHLHLSLSLSLSLPAVVCGVCFVLVYSVEPVTFANYMETSASVWTLHYQTL